MPHPTAPGDGHPPDGEPPDDRGRGPESSAGSPAAGDRVGEYVLEEPIGEGGFGTVWRARHAVLPGKTVAVKLPRDPELVELLRRESILQHGLDHPGVLKVLGVDLDVASPYIVQEYASGGDLASYLARRHKLPVDHALSVFREIVAVVAAAHARGVVHRDLKPGNVLLDGDGRVRVADFGLGRGLAALTTSALRHSIRSLDSFADRRFEGGTWEYMSPEQREAAASGPDEPTSRAAIEDPRQDVWALGIILYELLEGRRPAGRVGLAHVSPSLDAIFVRCWNTLENRYADARELLDDLDRLSERELQIGVTADDGDVTPSGQRAVASGAAGGDLHPSPPSRQAARRPLYSPSVSFWSRVFVLIPMLAIVSGLYLVWMKEREPESALVEVGGAAGAPPLDRLSSDEALRLGEIRRAIEAHPVDVNGAITMLNAYIVGTDDAGLRDKAFTWRRALQESSERRQYEVRWKGFEIDRAAYAEKLHSRLEPGKPDIYVRVYQRVDGEERLLFDSSSTVVEAWSHVWKPSATQTVPTFQLEWAVDDELRVELRESDVLGDNTISELRVDGGYSILLLSSSSTTEEGHRLAFQADFLFGN